MFHRLMSSIVVAVALLAVPAQVAAQTVQLADGRVLLATIEDTPDGQGLRVRRLDNGGLLELRWDQLSAASAFAIKRQFDLVGESQDEVLVRADEVEFLQNGGKQTLVGKIVDRTPDQIVVQVKGVLNRVPKSELLAVRNVEVPVTQVYTKDEYYAMLLAEQPPGTSADKHMLLAETLIKVRDYDRAAEHLQKAREIGESKNPQHLDALAQRLQRFKESAKELKGLEEIKAARSRGKLADFEKGTKLIAQFEKDFPQTKLKAEFDTEKKRFADARTRFLAGEVAEQWRRSIQIVADKKVAEEGTTLQAARDYAENKLTDDITARLAQVLKLEATEIKQLWADRARYPVGKRSEHFSYAIGSWVLGDTAILKGTEAGKAKEKQGGAPDPTKDREVDKLQKLLKQAMERRRAAVQGPAGGQQEQTEEDWWRDATRVERTGWLRAYYAEFGGQLVLTYQSVSPCISCYGEGTTPQIDSSGKMSRSKCFLCQGTKWLRSFKAY